MTVERIDVRCPFPSGWCGVGGAGRARNCTPSGCRREEFGRRGVRCG